LIYFIYGPYGGTLSSSFRHTMSMTSSAKHECAKKIRRDTPEPSLELESYRVLEAELELAEPIRGGWAPGGADTTSKVIS